MRVLFVSPAGGLGGAERCLLDVLAALRKGDPELELRVLLLERGPIRDQIERLGVPTNELLLPESLARLGETHSSMDALLDNVVRGLGASRELFVFGQAFRAEVARLQPDIVHSNGLKAHLLTATLLRHRPTVLHIHDFFGSRPLSRWLLRVGNRRGLFAITTSQAVAADFRRLMPHTPSQLIYNVVDSDRFTPGPGDQAWLAQLAGLPAPEAGTVSFGMVSTYARWKGHDLFLRAAARLKQSEAPLRFYVVGGPIYSTRQSQFGREELLQLSAQLGLERQLGLVPFQVETSPVYRALDVVVHPSTKPEPFGLTIVEAMACGLPVVVARNGGAQELFEDGRSALGFETGNDDDLAHKLRRLAGDSGLRERLGLAARRHVIQRFSPEPMGRQIRAIYERLMGRGREP